MHPRGSTCWHSGGMGSWAPTSTTWHARGASGAERSSPCRSKALLRTISSRGTGPSRHERPTLAFPERGGLVRDGPAAKDADPLPGGRECCAAALEAGHGYWQQRERGGCGCARQVTGADGSAAIRTGVQGGRVRSLGRCGVITRALSAWTPTQRSRTDCLPVSSFGAEWTVARLVHCQPAFPSARERVRMDGAVVVVCTSSCDHRFGPWSDQSPPVRSQPVVLCRN